MRQTNLTTLGKVGGILPSKHFAQWICHSKKSYHYFKCLRSLWHPAIIPTDRPTAFCWYFNMLVTNFRMTSKIPDFFQILRILSKDRWLPHLYLSLHHQYFRYYFQICHFPYSDIAFCFSNCPTLPLTSLFVAPSLPIVLVSRFWGFFALRLFYRGFENVVLLKTCLG